MAMLEGEFAYAVNDVLMLVNLGGNGVWEEHPYVFVLDRNLDGDYDYEVIHLNEYLTTLLGGAAVFVEGTHGYIRVEDIHAYVCSVDAQEDVRCADRIKTFKAKLELAETKQKLVKAATDVKVSVEYIIELVFLRVFGSMGRAACRELVTVLHTMQMTTAQAVIAADLMEGWGWTLERWVGGRADKALKKAEPTTHQLIAYHPSAVLKKKRAANAYFRADNVVLEWGKDSRRFTAKYSITQVVMTSEEAMLRALSQEGLSQRDIERVLANKFKVTGQV